MRRPGTPGPPPDRGGRPPAGEGRDGQPAAGNGADAARTSADGDGADAPRTSAESPDAARTDDGPSGSAAAPAAPRRGGRSFHLWPLTLLGAVLLAVLGVALVLRMAAPRITDEEVRDRVWAVLQRETPRSFLVTGALDISATARVENTKRFLPGILNLSLGTSSSHVRVPGRVSYGFDVRSLSPALIQVTDDLVEVTIPTLSVYSVEPNIGDMEVETDRGWARVGSTTDAVQQRALEIAQGALESQGQLHLARSTQPGVNTAQALERMLTPVVQAAGIPSPRFRFRIGERLVVEPAGSQGAGNGG